MSIRARPRPVMCSVVSLKGDPKFCGRKMLRFDRRVLSILENIWYSPLKYEFEDRACRRLPGNARFVTRSQTLRLTKRTAWRDLWRSRVCARFESAIRPTVRTIPRPPKDVGQHRYQDNQQVVKIELKRRLKPLKVDELIDQGHSLFIGKILDCEARQKHDEVG